MFTIYANRAERGGRKRDAITGVEHRVKMSVGGQRERLVSALSISLFFHGHFVSFLFHSFSRRRRRRRSALSSLPSSSVRSRYVA